MTKIPHPKTLRGIDSLNTVVFWEGDVQIITSPNASCYSSPAGYRARGQSLRYALGIDLRQPDKVVALCWYSPYFHSIQVDSDDRKQWQMIDYDPKNKGPYSELKRINHYNNLIEAVMSLTEYSLGHRKAMRGRWISDPYSPVIVPNIEEALAGLENITNVFKSHQLTPSETSF